MIFLLIICIHSCNSMFWQIKVLYILHAVVNSLKQVRQKVKVIPLRKRSRGRFCSVSFFILPCNSAVNVQDCRGYRNIVIVNARKKLIFHFSRKFLNKKKKSYKYEIYSLRFFFFLFFRKLNEVLFQTTFCLLLSRLLLTSSIVTRSLFSD